MLKVKSDKNCVSAVCPQDGAMFLWKNNGLVLEKVVEEAETKHIRLVKRFVVNFMVN